MGSERKKLRKAECFGAHAPQLFGRRLIIWMGLVSVFSIGTEHSIVSAQVFRRPSGNITPVMEAYRNRVMEFLKRQTTSRPNPIRRPGFGDVNGAINNRQDQDSFVVNGFTCKRTFSLFPNENNSRMYHLCARRHDGWYIYHYFCPVGTFFHDGMKKCMHDQSTLTTTTTSTRRTTTIRTRTTPPPSPTTSTESVTIMKTTTSEPEPVPEAEPNSTENGSFSSEESSTEDNTSANLEDVVVSVAGVAKTASDETAEEVTSESNASNEINMIPEGANKPKSRLPTSTQSQTKKTTKTISKLSSGGGVAAGGRRPRLLKKWRLYI